MLQRVVTSMVIVLALCFVGAAISACCGGGSGGSGGQVCLGEVEYMGKTYSPQSGVADRNQAQKNACNEYCLNGDSQFDAMYRIWADSPAGNAAGRPPKSKAIYQSQELLDYVTVTCANKCVADINSGALKGKVVCKQR